MQTSSCQVRTTVAAWLGFAALLAGGCGFERAGGGAMGTTYAIQADCPGSLPGDRIEAELARVDRLMSTYDPDSELSRFNRAPTGVPMPVSGEVVDVVDAAFEVAERTGGAFDATVAPLVALWGFGADAAVTDPSAEEVAAALRSVGYRRIAHRRDPPILEKRAPATLDLSAIAKGYAVDRLADVLDDVRCEAYLIEFGGEVRAFGNAPGGGPWRVGIESPSGAGLVADVVMRSGALATSGDYRQYREQDGVRVSHIIDPRTGFPVEHRLASATVVADTAMMADAYATALLVMGDMDGPKFADAAGLAAVFVVRAEGGFESFHSEAMTPYLNPR